MPPRADEPEAEEKQSNWTRNRDLSTYGTERKDGA